MARKRVPDNVHKLQGTYRSDRHLKRPPTPAHIRTGATDKAPPAVTLSKPPSCPKWLPEAAKKEWRRVVKVLAEYNILSALDQGIMAQYCCLHAQLQEFPEGFSAALHGQLRLLLVELGFTPSSRSKLTALQGGEDSSDPDGWNDL
jgi:phage terminase small subunit